MNAYAELQSQKNDYAKYLFLEELKHRNENVFYKLVDEHLKEMLPIIYTPTIAEAVEKFSADYRFQTGLIIPFSDQKNIAKYFASFADDSIDLIVVTDGEGVLGIGDQGVGGLKIAVGKLDVYTACAGINPKRVLPIQLDVGTNNEKLLNDPIYRGWRHSRIIGKAYDDFIAAFVNAVRKKFPAVFLHWEDFGRDNARKNLSRFQTKMCTFNDDMQGTGAVTLASILSALKITTAKIKDQKIVFFGAGTAATGIADQIVDAMMQEGISQTAAREKIFLLGRNGLLLKNSKTLTDFQKPYAKLKSNWPKEKYFLNEVVETVKPTILIGCSTVSGAFSENIIKSMANNCERPIIFPLSNPTAKSEAKPEDLLKWTNGKALIATGSPFSPVTLNGKIYPISQCNNAYIFPGLGLGIIAAKAKRCSDGMLFSACKELAKLAPKNSLLPDQNQLKQISKKIAKAVYKQAIKENLAKTTDIDKAIKSVCWQPK